MPPGGGIAPGEKKPGSSASSRKTIKAFYPFLLSILSLIVFFKTDRQKDRKDRFAVNRRCRRKRQDRQKRQAQYIVTFKKNNNVVHNILRINKANLLTKRFLCAILYLQT